MSIHRKICSVFVWALFLSALACSSTQAKVLVVVNQNGILEYDTTSGSAIVLPQSYTNGYSPVFGPDRKLYITNASAGGTGRFNDDLTWDTGFIAAGTVFTGATFDDAGNFYTAKSSDSSILKYNSAGQLIGTYVQPGAGGLSNPKDIVFGPDGKLYVSSYATNQVLRYNSGGTCDYTYSSASLSNPEGLAFDSAGYLYAVSRGNSSVVKINTATGAVSVFIASGDNGLSAPTGIAFDPTAGEFYVSSYNNANINIYNSSGTYVTRFAAPAGSGITQYNYYTALAPRPLIVANNAGVLKYDLNTGKGVVLPHAFSGAYCPQFGADGKLYVTSSVASPGGIGRWNSDFSWDCAFVNDGDALTGLALHPAASGTGKSGYWEFAAVPSINNGYIYNSAGIPFSYTVIPSELHGLSAPKGLIIDSDEKYYFSSYNTNQILRYNIATATFDKVFVDTGSGDSQLSGPEGLAFGLDNRLYVVSRGNAKVLRYNPDGSFDKIFVPAGDHGLTQPTGIAIDPNSGEVFVSDYNTANINIYSVDGIYQTSFPAPAGSGITSGNAYATISQGPVPLPNDIILDNFNAGLTDWSVLSTNCPNCTQTWNSSSGINNSGCLQFNLVLDNAGPNEHYYTKNVNLDLSGADGITFDFKGTGSSDIALVLFLWDSNENCIAYTTSAIANGGKNGDFYNAFENWHHTGARFDTLPCLGSLLNFDLANVIRIGWKFYHYGTASGTMYFDNLIAPARVYHLGLPITTFSPNDDVIYDTLPINIYSLQGTNLTLQVLNSSSTVIKTLVSSQAITQPKVTYSWDGKNDYGVTCGNGNYTVKISAVPTSGGRTTVQTAPIAINCIQAWPNGYSSVPPYFPIGVYFAGCYGEPDDYTGAYNYWAPLFQDIHDAGFNALSGNNVFTTPMITAYMQCAADKSLKVAMDDYPLVALVDSSLPIIESDTYSTVQAEVNFLGAYSSLLRYGIHDEPEEALIPNWTIVKRILAYVDGARPATSIFADPSSLQTAANLTQLSEAFFDNYPILAGTPNQNLGNYVQNLDGFVTVAGNNKKWAVLQTCSGMSGYYRYPTTEELRAMTYLALASGVTGIFYFTYPTGGGIDGLVDANNQHTVEWGRLTSPQSPFTTSLVSQLNTLAPTLLVLQADGALSDQTDYRIGVFCFSSNQNKKVKIVASKRPDTALSNLQIPVSGANLWSDALTGDTYQVSGGNLTVSLTAGAGKVLVENIPPVVSLTNPTNNSVYISPSSIVLSATATDTDGTISKVVFYRDGVATDTDTSYPYSVTWSSPTAGKHVLIAKAYDNLGVSTTSGAVNITVWNASDIGYTSPAGSSSFRSSDSTYFDTGQGTGMIGTSDQFRFLYIPVADTDLTVIAKVTSFNGTAAYAGAGVMIRQSTAANSKEICCLAAPYYTPDRECFVYRSSTGGSTTGTAYHSYNIPRWLKLVRVKSTNIFTAYEAPDSGGNPGAWSSIGSTPAISMSGTLYVGLAVTSGTSGTLKTGAFNGVSITTP